MQCKLPVVDTASLSNSGQKQQRKPQRITITISAALYDRLIEVSDHEGRSLSNLASHWLERYADEASPKAG
jgi:hypothetical protein